MEPAPVVLRAALAGVGAAIALGAVIGWLVWGVSNESCSPTDGWCELGAALVGALAAFVSGLAAYVVAGVVVIFRNRPAGERAGPVLFHLTVPPMAVITIVTLLGAL